MSIVRKTIIPVFAFLLFSPFVPSVLAGESDGDRLRAGDAITIEVLKPILEGEGYTVTVDEDKDLVVKKDNYTIFLEIGDSYIRIKDFWGIKDDVSELRRLKFVNEFNDKYNWYRATATGKDFSMIVVDYYIRTNNKISRNQVLGALKAYFVSMPRIMIELNKDHEILK